MPVTPKLKRLFLPKEIVKQIRWHKKGKHDSKDSDIKSHLVDGKAWQALDRFDPEFARDTRSARLGLLMDRFKPQSTDSSLYSY
jgi:hypothetical protein